MGNIIVGFIIGLIPLVLGIIKKKVKIALIGFVTCGLIWIVGTPLFGIPVIVIFVWLITKKINKGNANTDSINKFILIGILIPVVLTTSGVVANAVGGYASFYIFLGTPIILLIVGSYVFYKMNKENDKYQIRANSGIVMASEMISFITCSAVVIVFIQFHLVSSTNSINLQQEFESFFVLSIFIFGFSLLDILAMLLITLGIKRFKNKNIIIN